MKIMKFTQKMNLPISVSTHINTEHALLEAPHPYLIQQGFRGETIDHFGLDVFSRGKLKGCVSIPLHDHLGAFIGYAGLQTIRSGHSAMQYLFQAVRKQDGKVFEFYKSNSSITDFGFVPRLVILSLSKTSLMFGGLSKTVFRM